MTLFTQNRDMPTLSLKGRVCVPLFLFIFVLSQLITTSLFAQDLRNRTEDMYPFGTVIIAKDPLPDKVYEAQKNKIKISVFFLEEGTSNVILSSVDTGFVTETPGIIVTARHLVVDTFPEMDKIRTERRKTNPKFDYEYIFMGTIITDRAWVDFPLFLIAMGETGTFKDMMVLRTDIETMEKAQIIGDIFNPNPYNLLIRTSKFADANVGERVYISGFAPVVSEYLDKNKQSIPIYIDLINFTFPAEITASVGNMPGRNKTGLKKIFRLLDSAEPGFSGGKVININGHVIGMTIAMSLSKNFVYVISSQDIKQFLKDNKIK